MKKITIPSKALDNHDGDLKVKVLQQSICRTEKGFAGYLDACVAGTRVQIAGRFDNPWQGEGLAHIDQSVWVDGQFTNLDFTSGDVGEEIPGIPGVSAEDLFVAVGEIMVPETTPYLWHDIEYKRVVARFETSRGILQFVLTEDDGHRAWLADVEFAADPESEDFGKYNDKLETQIQAVVDSLHDPDLAAQKAAEFLRGR